MRLSSGILINLAMARTILLPITFLLFAFSAGAQVYNKPDHDTTYYRSYKGSIITRVFFSRNYNQFKLEPPANQPRISYHANTTLNIGVGLTYRFVSLSISKGLNFLRSDKEKGNTNSFDLQTHVYAKKWTIDALAEFYKGYYLNPPGLAAPDGQRYYKRPDMGTQTVGISANRVLNDKRFSYGAGLAQNASQEKSAGSFLLGAEAFYTAINGDSALVPYKADSVYNKENIHKIHLFEMGPGIGYAYTLVLKKHYFLLGSFNENLNFRISREIGNGVNSYKINFSPATILRLGAGYNSHKSGLSVSWFDSSASAEGKTSGYRYAMRTGSYRVVYVRRIAINHKMKTILEPGS
jgi:hypothetical protein